MARIKRRVKIRRPRPRAKENSGNALATLARLVIPALLFTAAGMVILVFILHQTGWFTRQADGVTAAMLDITRRAGFTVQEVVVEGRDQTDRENILQVMEITKGEPILAFNPQHALEKLGTISWVKSGTVERRLPSTLYIQINERTPIALWQNKQRFYLIDQEGHVLREATMDENLSLPRVVGEGAEKDAANLLSQLVLQPSVLSITKAAVRVGNRRWDLHIANNIVVKLPEGDLDDALARLAKLIQEQGILDRDIVALDMRLPDRMAIETTQPVNPPKKPKAEPKI